MTEEQQGGTTPATDAAATVDNQASDRPAGAIAVADEPTEAAAETETPTEASADGATSTDPPSDAAEPPAADCRRRRKRAETATADVEPADRSPTATDAPS